MVWLATVKDMVYGLDKGVFCQLVCEQELTERIFWVEIEKCTSDGSLDCCNCLLSFVHTSIASLVVEPITRRCFRNLVIKSIYYCKFVKMECKNKTGRGPHGGWRVGLPSGEAGRPVYRAQETRSSRLPLPMCTGVRRPHNSAHTKQIILFCWK